MTNNIVLHLDTTTLEISVEDTREVISVELARRLFLAGVVKDYNLAFKRLVIEDFNLEYVRSYYANSDLVMS